MSPPLTDTQVVASDPLTACGAEARGSTAEA
jgi:hypothetical protein